jgi:NAD(P)-dependent dehydrogenase (short-subunit alcohol dehydrogenase family)
MADRLANKVAIITGAASGQGKVAAGMFAREGALLVLADIDEEGLEITAADVREAGGDAMTCIGDLTTEAANEALLNATLERHGRVDVLYNAAGLVRFGSLHELSLEDWQFVVDHEVTMVFLTCRQVVRAMLEKGNGGSIINISSGSGFHSGTPRHTAHAATKAGVAGMSKQIAAEYGSHGIRCNAIAPGFLVYEEGQRRVQGQSRIMPADGIPLGRHVTPEDTAACAIFLASDDSSMLSGQTVSVDGGRSIK